MQLNYAESRLTQLEGCHCERTCSANGLVYRDKELWVEPENCRNCACKVSVTFVLKNHRITDFSITILKKKKKKKNVCQIECFNPFFIREVSLSTSKWKKPPMQGDSLSLFSTISFMLRNLLEKCLSISRGKTTEVCIISKTLSVKLLTAHYKLQTRANNTHYFMNLWSLGVYICKTVEGSDFKICDVITM